MCGLLACGPTLILRTPSASFKCLCTAFSVRSALGYGSRCRSLFAARGISDPSGYWMKVLSNFNITKNDAFIRPALSWGACVDQDHKGALQASVSLFHVARSTMSQPVPIGTMESSSGREHLIMSTMHAADMHEAACRQKMPAGELLSPFPDRRDAAHWYIADDMCGNYSGTRVPLYQQVMCDLAQRRPSTRAT